MSSRIQRGRLAIDQQLDTFLNQNALPGTGVEQESFWSGFEQLLVTYSTRNQALLDKREALQQQIDEYHKQGGSLDIDAYESFLRDIGYLVDAPKAFSINTQNVDPEIASTAGPQLVVPINNARYALNAANARWGSLYDAFYGTDVIEQTGDLAPGKTYNPARGQAVIKKAKNLLDLHFPLTKGSHANVDSYHIFGASVQAHLGDGETTTLKTSSQFKGYMGSESSPSAILLEHHGLHFELQFDSKHPIGKDDNAGMKDILVESALTTIMDCEDSVAAVDAEDKTLVYSNWLGLMHGELSTEVSKGDQTFTRSMNPDRKYISADGSDLVLPGRSVMFVRNVGHLMRNDAILLDDEPIFEGLMDGVITSLIAKHDLRKLGKHTNSKTGSVYIVKPKMHGPEEVAFTNEVFGAIEAMLDLPTHTLKIGIMDEERRTTVNLSACIASAPSRVVFINTGFLDRTGDEIHTSMQAGVFAPKAELKSRPWIKAYEKSNVAAGLSAGLSGKAQIGKGMWPMPDLMNAMMSAKTEHPQAGANTAWVPSPTAATLHALHYHQINVFDRQESLQQENFSGLHDILTVPLLEDRSSLTPDIVQQELDNNIQGILGYVVRWVHQGVGCSKVPDINHVGLMEDRATLRISSQHIANWLLHGVVTEAQIDETLVRLAKLVDEQNAGDPEYIPMHPDLDNSIGYQAARALIVEGTTQPSGYTEPLLHAMRQKMKATLGNNRDTI